MVGQRISALRVAAHFRTCQTSRFLRRIFVCFSRFSFVYFILSLKYVPLGQFVFQIKMEINFLTIDFACWNSVQITWIHAQICNSATVKVNCVFGVILTRWLSNHRLYANCLMKILFHVTCVNIFQTIYLRFAKALKYCASSSTEKWENLKKFMWLNFLRHSQTRFFNETSHTRKTWKGSDMLTCTTPALRQAIKPKFLFDLPKDRSRKVYLARTKFTRSHKKR